MYTIRDLELSVTLHEWNFNISSMSDDGQNWEKKVCLFLVLVFFGKDYGTEQKKLLCHWINYVALLSWFVCNSACPFIKYKNTIKLKEVQRRATKAIKIIAGPLCCTWLSSAPQSRKMTTEWCYSGDTEPQMAMTYNNNYAAAQLATNCCMLPYMAVLRSWVVFGESQSQY